MFSEYIENGFDIPFQNVFAESQKRFWSNSKKWRGVFQKRYFLIKVFVWTRRMQIWQLCRKFYAECQKNFAQSPTTQQKEKKLKNLFLQHVFEHVDNSSDKLSQDFWRKPENVSIRFRKTLGRIVQKKVFLIEVFVSLFRKQFSQFWKKKNSKTQR